MQVEAGMQSQDKACLEPAEAGGAREASPLLLLEGAWPCRELEVTLPVSRREGIKFAAPSPRGLC